MLCLCTNKKTVTIEKTRNNRGSLKTRFITVRNAKCLVVLDTQVRDENSKVVIK